MPEVENNTDKSSPVVACGEESVDQPIEVVEAVEMVQCPRCGQYKPAHHANKHLCIDCVKAENNRYSYMRRHNEDWMSNAQESGLDVWLQQPGETQWEYTIWCAYRDSYPGKKPTYSSVAKQLNVTYESVKKAAQRWSFPVRMQAWMSECDRITLAQRRQEILDMNKDHVDMAARMREKLSTAIDNIDPYELKPSDIVALTKTAAELERKARVDTIAQEEMRRDLLTDTENPDLKRAPTKQSDLSEVLGILLKAGALGDITQVGIRKTETTEVVVKE